MLKNWIENIKKDSERYNGGYWKYHISGNVAEFSVPSSFEKEKHTYRIAVIKIGQVLQALTLKFEENGFQTHIQSFPSFENPQLIAALRFNFSKPAVSPRAGDTGLQPCDFNYVKKLAAEKNLLLREVSNQQFSKLDAPDFLKEVKWFVLCSDDDNPFTWLKTGYWKELVYHSLCNIRGEKPILIDEYSFPNSDIISDRAFEDKFVQILVGLECSLIT